MALKLNQKREFGRESISAATLNRFDDYSRNFTTKKPLGFKRTLGTALSIILGGVMCYASLHYIPAFVTPPKIISVADFTKKSQHLKDENTSLFLSAYIDAFNISRAYIRKGQTVEAQYLIPEGNMLSLTIEQCKAMPVIEVFHCTVAGSRNVQIENSPSGLRTFTFSDDGFYMFGEVLEGPLSETDNDKKRYVIWSRQ